MPTRPAPAKLIETATRLFYANGISATGVDAIVAKSGVSKPTLYAHFGTKTGLVAAVLEHQHRLRRDSLEEHLATREALPARERLLSVFDWVADQQRSDWRRGCPFVNASVELGEMQNGTGKGTVNRHKRWFRGKLTELAALAGAAAPAVLASQIHLLIEGANARMLAESDTAAIFDGRASAELLLDHALRARRPDTRDDGTCTPGREKSDE